MKAIYIKAKVNKGQRDHGDPADILKCFLFSRFKNICSEAQWKKGEDCC
jgi:hypothetical protein